MRNGGERFSRRSSVSTITSGWRWWRADKLMSPKHISTITTMIGPICSTAPVRLHSVMSSRNVCRVDVGVRMYAHSVYVCSDGITPGDGSVSPDFFSDLQPQNGDLHLTG